MKQDFTMTFLRFYIVYLPYISLLVVSKTTAVSKTPLSYSESFHDCLGYRKIPIVSPGLIFVQKAFLAGLIFGGAYFRSGLLSEGILHFKMGWACQ